MSDRRTFLSTFAAIGLAVLVGLTCYFLIGGSGAGVADATAPEGTTSAAQRAGATVTPTAPPLRIEPK